MTKEQKEARQTALELVQRFGMLGMKWAQTDYFTLDKENAKQCAIIACEEILKALKTTTDHLTLNRTDLHGVKSDEQYWEKIIHEINKL